MNVLNSYDIIAGKFFRHLSNKSFTGAEGNLVEDKYYTSCMIHINSTFVLPILLPFLTAGVLETARRFVLVLIHGYYRTWGKMFMFLGIRVIRYRLEHLMVNIRILHFTLMTICAQWGVYSCVQPCFTGYDGCFYDYFPLSVLYF